MTLTQDAIREGTHWSCKIKQTEEKIKSEFDLFLEFIKSEGFKDLQEVVEFIKSIKETKQEIKKAGRPKTKINPEWVDNSEKGNL